MIVETFPETSQRDYIWRRFRKRLYKQKQTKGDSPTGVAFVTLNEKYNGYRY